MNNQVKKFPEELLPDEYSSTPGIIYTTPEVQEEENPIAKTGLSFGNGEVKEYFLPEAFDWVSKKRAGVRKINRDCIGMRKKRFIIYEEAAQMLNLKKGDRISIGVNKKYILITKDKTSEIKCISNSTWGNRKLKEGKEYITLIASSVRILRETLDKHSWPETFTIPVNLQDNMLVGKKPVSSPGTGCEPGEEKQEKIHPWRSKPMSKEEFREKILANKGECRR